MSSLLGLLLVGWGLGLACVTLVGGRLSLTRLIVRCRICRGFLRIVGLLWLKGVEENADDHSGVAPRLGVGRGTALPVPAGALQLYADLRGRPAGSERVTRASSRPAGPTSSDGPSEVSILSPDQGDPEQAGLAKQPRRGPWIRVKRASQRKGRSDLTEGPDPAQESSEDSQGLPDQTEPD